MLYLLVQNKTTVLLGPMSWRQRFIQSEINDLVDAGDLSTAYQVPPAEQGYVDLGDGFEIFPIVASTGTDHDPIYQALAGPYYTYDSNLASESYTVLDQSLDSVKQNLRPVVAAERYRRENAGTSVTVQDQQVTVDTSRDNRNTLVQAFLLMSETDTVNWKFPEGFLNLTYADIESVVSAGATYIQTQFNWEVDKLAEIDAAADIPALQAITIVEPVIIPSSK